jgi:hypothetical protein
VYVVCLTQLTVSRKWGDHIAQLVWDGIDLKYPFLRELATQAALDRRDTAATMDAKLATHRMDALRWALSTMQAQARAQGADFLVALVPSVNSSRALQAAFAGVRPLLDDLGIVSVDLLHTFQDAEDFSDFMVAEGNVHPNALGHRRILRELLRAIEANPQVADVVLGRAAGATHGSSGPQR